MKKFLLFFVLMIGLNCSVWCYDFSAIAPSGQTLYYDINGNDVTVTKGDVWGEGDIVIPSSVVYGGNAYSVTTIGVQAFLWCTGLSSITIPNSVTTISWEAFSGCTGLSSVTIPNSVTTIDCYAFSECTGLSSVTILNSVTTIGCYAFSGCTGLSSVTIPNSVTTIDMEAFSGCTGLTSVTIPNSVTTIGAGAFSGCTGLSSVTIPNSVTTIDCYAFSECTGLTAVTIPTSVTDIGASAFSNCTGMVFVNFNASDANFVSLDYDIHFGSDWYGIFYGCTALETFNIGSNVHKIPDYICAGCTSLTSITIPNSVTHIGPNAFRDCTGLISITIPNSVTSIGINAFRECTGLLSVNYNATSAVLNVGHYGWHSDDVPFYNCTGIEIFNIGANVESIPDRICRGCTGLTSITIPNSVTSIGTDAFTSTGLTSTNYTGTIAQWCNIDFPVGYGSIGNPIGISHNLFINNVEITDCVIPDGVTQIKNGVFWGWYGMNSVTIPNSVTSIGGSAFGGCTGLTRTNYTGTVAQWCNIDFEDNPIGYSHNLYINDSEVSNLVIPEGVTRVKGCAFSGCTGLSTLTFPSSVTNIDNHAFSGCEGLNSITFQGHQPPTFGEGVFDNVPTNCIVNVPCGTQALYIARLTNFYNFMEQTFQFSAESENESMGTVQVLNVPTCTNPNAVLYAVANNGYHFDHWSTGSIENPYSFTVTDSIAVIAYFASNSGIDEKELAGFNVHPNPTMGIVTIQLNPEICNPNSEIHVFDMYARRIQIFSVTGESTPIDISHYASGIYLVKLVNDGKVMFMGKVVKR